MPVHIFSTSLLHVAMAQIACRRVPRAALLLLATLVFVPDVLAGDRLTVRVYGERHWDDGERLPVAVETAAAIVNETGLDVDWLDCRARALPQACTIPRGPRDLIVRLTPRYTAAAEAAGEAVRAGEPGSDLILGVAVVDATTHAGALATIFLEHVATVASRVNVDRSSLLGRVVAHEIGHLLRGKEGHSSTGLMREVWTGEELGLNRRGDWSFDLPGQQEIRAAIARR
jgi:hypothetical protein